MTTSATQEHVMIVKTCKTPFVTIDHNKNNITDITEFFAECKVYKTYTAIAF